MTPRSPLASGALSAIAAAASRIALKVPTRLIWIVRAKCASGCGPFFREHALGNRDACGGDETVHAAEVRDRLVHRARMSESLVTSVLMKRARPLCWRRFG